MSVGARAFSAPEQLVGMASKREIGKLTDVYALGTLLYQLFNLKIFAYPRATDEFEKIIRFLHMVMGSKTMEQKEEIWAREVPKFRHQLEPPRIDGAGHSIPPSLIALFSETVRSMTIFDYKERLSDLGLVLKRVDSAIAVLENIQLDRKLTVRRERKKERRIEKLAYQKQKLEEYLARRKRLAN
jgi:serine/threonine protein kinase